ncbi:MAG: hypothetical protein ABR501_05460 [Pyrinomonadaceae bacterium]
MRIEIHLIAWTVRLVWPIALIWGLIDLALLWSWPLSPKQAQMKVEDVASRLSGGAILFLIWVFMIRRRGSRTLNKGGRLER